MSAQAIQRVEETALPVMSETAAIIQVIERAASNPAVDIDKLERLLEMRERMAAQGAEKAFNVALNQAQSEVTPVATDATNTQTKSKYATYAALDRAIRPLYTRHGFSLSFGEGDSPKPDHVRVLCYVAHSEGHTRTYHADLPADGKGAKGGDVMTKTHATGSAFSYGQRYLLKLIFNIAVGEDDDGNRAGGPTLNAKQVETIRRLLKEAEANEGAFLSYLGVETVEAIRASKFADAVDALNAKKRQRANG